MIFDLESSKKKNSLSLSTLVFEPSTKIMFFYSNLHSYIYYCTHDKGFVYDYNHFVSTTRLVLHLLAPLCAEPSFSYYFSASTIYWLQTCQLSTVVVGYRLRPCKIPGTKYLLVLCPILGAAIIYRVDYPPLYRSCTGKNALWTQNMNGGSNNDFQGNNYSTRSFRVIYDSRVVSKAQNNSARYTNAEYSPWPLN